MATKQNKLIIFKYNMMCGNIYVVIIFLGVCKAATIVKIEVANGESALTSAEHHFEHTPLQAWPYNKTIEEAANIHFLGPPPVVLSYKENEEAKARIQKKVSKANVYSMFHPAMARFSKRFRREVDLDGDLPEWIRNDEDCKQTLEQTRQENDGKPLHLASIVKLGETLRLTCHYCGKHDDEENLSKLWYKREHGDENFEELDLDMHDDDEFNRIYTLPDHTLVVKHFQGGDEGTYNCKSVNGQTNFLYRIDGLVEPAIKRFVAKDIPNFLQPSDPISDEKDGNWRQFTKWGTWGPCDGNECGKQGERQRKGICLVEPFEKWRKVNPDYLNTLLKESYTKGAFCHTTIFEKHSSILERPYEIEVEHCIVECKETNQGSKLNINSEESFKNVAVQSHLKNKPKPVQTTTIEEHVGKSVKLFCPGASMDSFVQWTNGSFHIKEGELRQKELGRVEMDPINGLFIHSLKPQDTAMYSCYVNAKLTMMFRVKVILTPPDGEKAAARLYVGLTCAFNFLIFLGVTIIRYKQRMVQIEQPVRHLSKHDHLQSWNNSIRGNSYKSNYSSSQKPSKLQLTESLLGGKEEESLDNEKPQLTCNSNSGDNKSYNSYHDDNGH
ncbi:unnamed protein product [Owenia fusiformis]|uniref:Uncharacterized protein n=1 Tax=Owenia fusiformis TaxID=6347 RepID=A0A8J1XW60_OWEFU|nr:unnamed protein product [Owenia fusiformis]